jgi:hypothetical protein
MPEKPNESKPRTGEFRDSAVVGYVWGSVAGLLVQPINRYGFQII